MALRINTNIAALSAHTNMIKNDNGLSASLEKLSSGLRINRAADDSAGMAIADSLKSQFLGLGQAVRNANDGISMVQTADGALDESIKIVNTVKTKAIQAAQDGQTTESRKAIQADIDKLLEELDTIAKTTAFNNQKLLSGNFVNKKFQVGAYSGETVNISIGTSESTKVGHVTTGKLELTNQAGGTVQLSIYSNLQSKSFTLQAVDIQANNDAGNGMGALADAINKLSDVLGVSASAVVTSTSEAAVADGITGSDFSINGVTIGAVNVVANDSDGALAKAINNKTADHGVLASVGADGKLTLTSIDGRAIKVSGSTGTALGASQLSTFGYVKLNQAGSNELLVTDLASGSATSFTASLAASAAFTTSIDSTLTAGSAIASASTFKAGSTAGVDITGLITNGNITTTMDSTIKAGSSISSASTLKSGTLLGGIVLNNADVTVTQASKLATGSVLASGSTLKAGTLVTTAIRDSSGTTIAAGSMLSADIVTSGDFTLAEDMIIAKDSVFAGGAAGGSLAAGSYLYGDIVASSAITVTEDMTLKTGSILIDDAGTTLTLKAGSTLGGDVTTSSALTTTVSMTLKAGSTIASASTLANGSTLGGAVKTTNALTLQSAVTLTEGSILFSGSSLEHGTILANDIYASGGFLLKAGTTLETDYVSSGTNTLAFVQTLAKDSTIAAGSTLAANAGGVAGTKVGETTTSRLSDVSVLTQEGAQVAIAVADSALKDLDKVRSDLGSVQNQLVSTIANLSATKVNIASAESSIRDVDFAEEAANFSKMQILNQASSFAMAQANASSKTVLSLLQG
ncbi:MAG: flagellin [Desulfurivibrionaceae bacterium]